MGINIDECTRIDLSKLQGTQKGNFLPPQPIISINISKLKVIPEADSMAIGVMATDATTGQYHEWVDFIRSPFTKTAMQKAICTAKEKAIYGLINGILPKRSDCS